MTAKKDSETFTTPFRDRLQKVTVHVDRIEGSTRSHVKIVFKTGSPFDVEFDSDEVVIEDHR